MDLKEYFKTWSPYGSDHPNEILFDGETMVRFAEEYYQAKSLEEAEEEQRIVAALAAFGKEEEG